MEFLNTKLFIFILVLSACSNAPDVHPTILDFQLNEARVYKVIDKKNFTIQFDKSIPIEQTDHYMCISAAEAAMSKEYLLNHCTCK